jgi:hypothetical protein
VSDVLDPEEVLADLRRLDPALRRERYYGERSLFYNPGGQAPLGTIFCSIKDRDGPNDKASSLSRAGVYRFAFEMTEETFEQHFGPPPRRPPKGRLLDLPEHDLTALRVLTPHPVYAWMRWAQVLSPSAETFAAVRPLLGESLGLVRQKWQRRRR